MAAGRTQQRSRCPAVGLGGFASGGNGEGGAGAGVAGEVVFCAGAGGAEGPEESAVACGDGMSRSLRGCSGASEVVAVPGARGGAAAIRS